MPDQTFDREELGLTELEFNDFYIKLVREYPDHRVTKRTDRITVSATVQVRADIPALSYKALDIKAAELGTNVPVLVGMVIAGYLAQPQKE